ncbi:uncharacterized protein PITG_16503 [Phytophthora infestans T30-4]|uniref:Uncharacterized protein n=1 Tax=Phytophthora infestans (strain T30-4) TaxID=403677 RepID=D0NTT0_PHYIT|nr:uncharacterized protein PITG_16503 [Phytophthora infestans T30-4]EEY65042.1 conserved hypothetical protein [Phytophthora infestans T30-4]|eukprot:XP_002897530.1 conserved hypothetical protein [Phytophthora infestans T30-4]
MSELRSSEIAALDGNEDTKTEEDEEQHAVCSRSRPVALSAIEDTAVVTTKGEPQQPRGRYIMSTRLEALPTTKRILYEYPIPKEVLDALERHRHFHVDDSSPLTAFKPIRLPHPTPTELYSATCTNIVWECFYRHSVPVERSPVSFVLSSLDVAPERPLPPASDLFHLQQLIAATTDDSILYTNYVICMTALTTFIETFERRYIANWTSNFLKISRLDAKVVAIASADTEDGEGGALTASTGHVREILLVTHVEVGDFVMYHGDFNLTKMEHDVTEI